MSFFASSFSYAGEASEMYHVQIASVDSGGVTTNPGAGNIEILEAWPYRRDKPFFLGTHYSEKFTFPVSFLSEDEITAQDFSALQHWLFNRPQYHDLSVIQSDMDDFVISCIFVDPRAVRVGNILYGITGTGVANSPFGYTYPKTNEYLFQSSPSNYALNFYNNSHSRNYLYPLVEFTMNGLGGTLTITNTSDSDRVFQFTGLTASDAVTANGDLGIVTSTLSAHPLSLFNKQFLRFIPGLNRLTVSGNISNLSLTYQFARRIGG